MSINHPKAKQIRLPFSVRRPSRGAETTRRICGICRKRDSRYTCPRCNVAYCSLDCFRSQKHAQCSEPFYRTTVMEAISTDERAGLEEKKAMLEMLRRFEEGAAGDEEALRELEEDDDEDSEDEELRALLEIVDLDDIDSNKLFHLLPPRHRDKFLAALRDPDSVETKELLHIAVQDGLGETGLPSVLPWWERPDPLDDPAGHVEAEEGSDGGPVSGAEDGGGDGGGYGNVPELVSGHIVEGVKPPEGSGVKLAYNALAICLAYLHTLLSLRLPSLSPAFLSDQGVSPSEVKEEILRLVPFLADKSTTRYTVAREAYSSVWETIGRDSDPPPSVDALLRLLDTLSPLLHPPLVTSIPPKLLIALSDLYGLFATPKPGAAVPRKLVFYLAALRALKRDDWVRLEREVRKEAARLRAQVEDEPDEDVDRPALRILEDTDRGCMCHSSGGLIEKDT